MEVPISSIIDSHVHVWDPGLGGYDWLAAEAALNRAFLPADITRSTSVVGMIFVQAGAADGLAEARWVDSLAAQWPELLGIVASAPLEQGADVKPRLTELRQLDRLVGIRRLLQDEPVEFFESEELIAGLQETAATGLPFDACIRHHQLPALTALLSHVPDLRVVLDHLGKPPVASGEVRTWRSALEELAANPNVFVKLSGIAPEAAPDQPLLDQAIPYLAAALEVFGADRCMVGSDWPVSSVTNHHVAYDEWFDLVLDNLQSLGADRETLGWRTAARFYSVEPPARLSPPT